MEYQRNTKTQSVFYKIMISITLLFILITLWEKAYDYIFLLLIVYILIEVFASPKMIEISPKKLITSKLYFGGLYKRTQTFIISNIKTIQSIGLDVSNDSYMEEGSGIFWWLKGSADKPFDLYQVTYNDEQNKLKKIKIHLHPNECNILRNMCTVSSSEISDFFLKKENSQ